MERPGAAGGEPEAAPPSLPPDTAHSASPPVPTTIPIVTKGAPTMRTFTAIIERCPVTGQYVGHVPALPGAHTHAETLDQLHYNLVEVVTLVLEDQDREPETEFVVAHTVRV